MQDSLINNLLYVTRQPFAVKPGLTSGWIAGRHFRDVYQAWSPEGLAGHRASMGQTGGRGGGGSRGRAGGGLRWQQQ
jgi:hypothetical protein